MSRVQTAAASPYSVSRSEEHTSELQSPCNLVCRLLLEKKNRMQTSAGEILVEAGAPPLGVFVVAAGSVEALSPPSSTQAAFVYALLYLMVPRDFIGDIVPVLVCGDAALRDHPRNVEVPYCLGFIDCTSDDRLHDLFFIGVGSLSFSASVYPSSLFFFFLMIRPPPRSPLFPSTPLFR